MVKRRFHIDHVDNDRCTACEECVHICPEDCFEMKDVDGKIVAVFSHPDKCTFCGKCLSVCDDKAIILNDIDNDKYVKVMHPELCEACEYCVTHSKGKNYQIVEEKGLIFSKQVGDSEECDGECFFSCPHQAVVFVEKKKDKPKKIKLTPA